MQIKPLLVLVLAATFALPLTSESAFAAASGDSSPTAGTDAGGDDDCKITPKAGSADFIVPKGATGYKYEVIDWDPLVNDTLNKGSNSWEGDLGGAPVNIPFDLKCKDGDVAGDAGSSGETECSVFVRITFTFPGGATSSQDSGYTTVTSG